MPRRTASAVIPIVRPPTMSRVSQRVTLPNRRRPASSSCPSWAMADDGASTPVASAMPTGKASITEKSAKPDVWPVLAASITCGFEKPETSIATPMPTNDSVMSANRILPQCPNHVSAGDEQQEAERDRHARGVRRREVRHDGGGAGGDADRDREDEVDDEGAERQEGEALAERGSGGRGGAAALREAADELVVVGDHDGDDADDDAHGRQQQREVAAQRAQGRLDGVGHRRDRVRHDGEREGDEEDGPVMGEPLAGARGAAARAWRPDAGRVRGRRHRATRSLQLEPRTPSREESTSAVVMPGALGAGERRCRPDFPAHLRTG